MSNFPFLKPPHANNSYQTNNSKPFDPLNQLSMCCGLSQLCNNTNNKRNLLTFQSQQQQQQQFPNHFYANPQFDPTSNWALALATQQNNSPQHQQQQQQPYVLLSQPVILTTSPNQTNTMCLVQHASQHSSAPTGPSGLQNTSHPFQALTHWVNPISAPQQQHIPGSLISSQYAIYQTSTGPIINPANFLATTGLQQQQQVPITTATTQLMHPSIVGPPPIPITPAPVTFSQNSPQRQPSSMMLVTQQQQPFSHKVNNDNNYEFPQSSSRQARCLDADTFRQLEVIEKQVDLSDDLAFIERFGTVITRAINPNNLRPYLQDHILIKYQNLLKPGDGFVIRFMEIIKRPGQTLGLYIRSVRVESSGRVGLVITKIESDSPIYNSQVIHVGDEILSINLIDVKGMSIDDVVIIMSLPKRLVLAMRVPAYPAYT